MSSIRSSSSLLRKSHIANHAQVVGIFRALHISQWQSEPHQQNQNPCKRSYPQTLKTMTNTLLDRSGSPVCTWLLCLMQVSVLFLKLTYNLTLGGIQLHCAEGSTSHWLYYIDLIFVPLIFGSSWWREFASVPLHRQISTSAICDFLRREDELMTELMNHKRSTL
jgi:hypothetical protein